MCLSFQKFDISFSYVTILRVKHPRLALVPVKTTPEKNGPSSFPSPSRRLYS